MRPVANSISSILPDLRQRMVAQVRKHRHYRIGMGGRPPEHNEVVRNFPAVYAVGVRRMSYQLFAAGAKSAGCVRGRGMLVFQLSQQNCELVHKAYCFRCISRAKHAKSLIMPGSQSRSSEQPPSAVASHKVLCQPCLVPSSQTTQTALSAPRTEDSSRYQNIAISRTCCYYNRPGRAISFKTLKTASNLPVLPGT